MIRRLQTEDQPTLQSWASQFVPHPEFNWTPQALVESLLTCEVWGIFQGEELMAAVAILVQPESWEILWLATAPGQERCGWMQKLLLERLNDASCRNVEILLEVHENNQKARSLYNQLGFTQAGVRKNYYKDGANALVLTFKAIA